MTTEKWLDVVGYEGVYQVSNRGRVKRIAGGMGATPGRILKLQKCKSGYLEVGLYRNRKQRKLLVHRLVLEAFVGLPPSQTHQANHRNGTRDDNYLENLEWVTPRENEIHAREHLGKVQNGESNPNARLTRHEVQKTRELYAAGKHTQVELAEALGVSRSTISFVVRGDRWQHVDGPIVDAPAHGETHYNARLTRNDVERIRRLYAAGKYSQANLAEMFGIGQASISHIINRRTWKHIP